MWNRVSIAVLGVCLMLLFSCGSSRRGSSGREEASPDSFSFETFNAKVGFSVGNMTMNATLRMKRDSFLFVSVQPFAGIEVARIFVSDKEVCLVDRMNKRYSQFSIREIPDYGELLGVDKLQAMLTNQLFLLREGNKAVKVSDFSVSQVASFFLLQYGDPKNRFSQEFTTDEHYRISNATLTSTHGSLRWEYSQFEALENGYVFPMKVDLTMSESSVDGGFSPRRSSQEMSFYYKKIELNKECSFSNPIPKGYEKVSVEELLSVLNNKR
ncbi:MAG: DUF4292 domain-containing protein [Paludibacteraceae bacterium]|nr:DUF4292 domain-containing protein [Paludibacteraceae bacterium]